MLDEALARYEDWVWSRIYGCFDRAD
jgi:hypothetical protein